MSDRRERGAAAVEYALIIALLVIGLIGAISRFEDRADDRYTERSTQGDPSEAFGNLGPTDGGTAGGTDGSTPPGGAVAAVTILPLSATRTASGNLWSMTVTVRVEGDGVPIGGVEFTAPTWNPSTGSTLTCTSTTSGVCTYTQSGIDRNSSALTSATFTLGTPSYMNPDGSSPTFSGPASATITCEKPSKGSGTDACT